MIYDKIKENTESHGPGGQGSATTAWSNMSMNQVFMRSVNTSLVVLLPILSLLLFGGDTLKDFAFAMFIGVATGAYSSIFVAAPVLAILKEREPRYRQLQERTAAREAIERPRRAGGSAASPPPPATAAATGGDQRAAAAARDGADRDRRSARDRSPSAKPPGRSASGGRPWSSSRSRR